MIDARLLLAYLDELRSLTPEQQLRAIHLYVQAVLDAPTLAQIEKGERE